MIFLFITRWEDSYPRIEFFYSSKNVRKSRNVTCDYRVTDLAIATGDTNYDLYVAPDVFDIWHLKLQS